MPSRSRWKLNASIDLLLSIWIEGHSFGVWVWLWLNHFGFPPFSLRRIKAIAKYKKKGKKMLTSLPVSAWSIFQAYAGYLSVSMVVRLTKPTKDALQDRLQEHCYKHDDYYCFKIVHICEELELFSICKYTHFFWHDKIYLVNNL